MNEQGEIQTGTGTSVAAAVNIGAREAYAILLLRQFIEMGYPAIDPIKQVNAAFEYADAFITRDSR